MSTRLEIAIFGTYYRISALRFSKDAAKAGIAAFGARKWDQRIRAIALQARNANQLTKLAHTIGYSIEMIFTTEGIAMQGGNFGLEVFHGGQFAPIDMVEADTAELLPETLMQDFKRNDMLAVFWARRDGIMTYRWADVNQLDQTDLVLHYNRLATLLGRKRNFDLVMDVRWQGKNGRRDTMKDLNGFTADKHVFHLKK